ncbi:MAG: pitrilysin family protein [Gemmatimonadales bacterium]|nr:pitrilysin family protein [Gemmatimonadales bacterium]
MLRRLPHSLAALAAAAALLAPAPSAAQQRALTVPVAYHRLPNGLRVVLSRDPASPTVAVAVYYNIGFRLEPKGRTGFAHLFEHMMFQGSRNLGKMEFIKLVEQNGGALNGSTRFDFTNYYQVVPAGALRTILWGEADRMRGLAIDQSNLDNQRDVVKNEVRVNVLNQPYGGFPWLDMPQAANTNWHNAHNFYGDLGDLDAANLDDVKAFFRTYYAPNNAVVAVVGDFEPAQALAWVTEYFGTIPAQELPAPPDLTEPEQVVEKRVRKEDRLATRPALALGYHVPERWTTDWFAFGLIDQLLAQGRDSWFYDEVVRRRGYASGLSGGINVGLGNQFNYKGPMLWIVSAFHDAATPSDSLVGAMDAAIRRLQERPVDAATLERARTKLRSSLYSAVESFSGFGRADLLASFALFDDDPARLNTLEAGFAKVTPADVQAAAQKWLRPTNRTILTVSPAAAPAAGGAQ